VAIGSLRPPKVNAAYKVFQQIYSKLGVEEFQYVDFLTREVKTEVNHTPTSQEELMLGTERRSRNLIAILKKEQMIADYYIGMEGGFHQVKKDFNEKPGGGPLVFLQSWAYVSNGREGYFGASGMIEVPHQIFLPVLHQGEELNKVIDEITEQKDIRNRQGIWGVLTGELVTRQDSFEQALVAALAPFYNSKLYRS
jgi:inosine/xanthosine triphosphatase